MFLHVNFGLKETNILLNRQDIPVKKYHSRLENHAFSEISKHKSGKFHRSSQVCVGDLVFLISDKDKYMFEIAI